MNSPRLDHLNMTVQNYSEAIKWYTKIFGFEEVEYGLTKEGHPWESIVRDHRLPTYYGSPLRYPHSTSWYVKDPSGYMIEVALWDEDRVEFDQ